MPKRKSRKAEEVEIDLPEEIVAPHPAGGRKPIPVPFGGGGFGDDGDTEEIPEDFSPIKELMIPGKNSGELDVRSDINELQMIQMARARFIAEDWFTPALHDFVDNVLRLSVSKGRKGRKEVVAAYQSATMGDGEAATGVWARMSQYMGR